MSTAPETFSESDAVSESDEMSELQAIRAELVRIRSLPLEEQPAAFDRVRMQLEGRLSAEPPKQADK